MMIKLDTKGGKVVFGIVRKVGEGIDPLVLLAS